MLEAELAALSADFKRYLSGAPLGSQFGRDEPYDHPHTGPTVRTEEFRHLYLADPNKPWLADIPRHRRTSDHYIVYCQGTLDEATYLLIALLNTDGHEQTKNNKIIYSISLEVEQFKLKY
ncbi:MAG: type II toxin-antitoxin system YafO family toxin [Candidatus Azotimanducaceae bacterium WSBS_2022_MAG_OTU7]